MSTLHIPAEGLSLSHTLPAGSDSKNGPPQIIRLDLAENKMQDIVQSLRRKDQATLRLGKKTILQFGTQKLPLQPSSDNFLSEVFVKSSAHPSSKYFSGKLSHTLEVQNAKDATAKSDEALAALENTLKSMQEQRASNETSFIRSKDEMKQIGKKAHQPSPLVGQSAAMRKDHLLGNAGRSTPSSPYLSASYSPSHGPTSAPLLATGGLSAKDRLRLDAIKIPLLHLLAAEPMTPKAVCEMLQAPRADCERMLDKHARDCKAAIGKKELKEKSYRELDIWKFPYRKAESRQHAIDHAVSAFDRMRIEKTDPIWQMLLRPEERGKGKTLSRLNFDKPIHRPSTPKPDPRLGDDAKAEFSDIETHKVRAKKITSDAKVEHPRQKTSTKEREKNSKAVGHPEKPGSSKESALPTAARSSKLDVKYKSSERIENSDEEAETAEVVTTKHHNSLKRKQPSSNTPAQSSKRPLSPSPKKQLHRSNLSNSSSSSENNSKADGASHSTKQALKPRPRAESSSRISPRPRTDSSPPKPSPLGSSPPATSTDLESSGSSKAPSQSSAPSSPPSSTDMPLSKKNDKYSPIIAEKRHDSTRGRSPIKRKSDSNNDSPPAKRHQPNGVGANTPQKETQDHRERPSVQRQISESDRSSSSSDEPGPTREAVIGDAKIFQKYYQKYKDLHDKIAQMPEKDREDKDMEDLWKMHKRLKEMKTEIWNSWDRVEKAVVA